MSAMSPAGTAACQVGLYRVAWTLYDEELGPLHKHGCACERVLVSWVVFMGSTVLPRLSVLQPTSP